MKPSTRQERQDLIYTLKQRGKVARADIEAYGHKLLADFEKELAARYPANNPAWAEITAAARTFVQEADRKLAER